jgi:hypothetical protein
MKARTFLFCMMVILSMTLHHLYAQDIFSFNGYYKSFFVVFKQPDYRVSGTTQTSPPLGSVADKLRLQFVAVPLEWLSFHLTYQIVPTIQDPSLFGQSLFLSDSGGDTYRLIDFDSRLYPVTGESVDSFAFFHNLDRLNAVLKLPFADIIIGRQAIAWGSAHVFNPTDILAPYAFTELDTEERSGVDALRVRIPLGMLDELDIGYVAGKDLAWKKSAAFARVRVNIWDTDLTIMSAAFRQNLLLGVDMTRSLGGAGVWLEGAYVMPDLLKEDAGSGREDDYLGVAVGLDYNFDFNLYVFVEYYFNSAGSNNPEDYITVSTHTAYRDGAVYLLGQHYINLGLTYQLHPLIPVSALFMWNVTDLSLMVNLSLEYNIAENIYLTAGTYIGFGAGPEKIEVAPGVYVPRLYSEFGAYPEMVYTSFRIYF